MVDIFLSDGRLEAQVLFDDLTVERFGRVWLTDSDARCPCGRKLSGDQCGSVFGNCHTSSFRLSEPTRTIAEVGEAANLPGGGAVR